MTQENPSRDEARRAGIDVQADFERFNQKNDIYNRASWDPRVDPKTFFASYDMARAAFRNAEGYRQEDYALRNAAWHLTDFTSELKEAEDRREGFLDTYTLHREGSPVKLEVPSPEAMSADVKRASRFLGADLVGICRRDDRWIYSHNYSRLRKQDKALEIPEALGNVVVLAVGMDYDITRTTPSAMGGAGTGLGYSKDVLMALSLAQYIRNLGYQAVASLNDTALSIPMAIQAGLGEYGRLGLLITKEFGPRVRLGKVFTDLPLAPDKPIRFGVKEFCGTCRRCEQACPPKAIPGGDPSTEVYNVSNLKGVRKWSVDAEKCFGFWVKSNTECAICIRVCPYNKDYRKWIYRMGRRLAGTPLRGLMLRLDILLRYGVRKLPSWWRTRLA
jgi:reductive dehalogenase